jgi:uncharacterized protein (TIGR03437 family)
MSGLPFNTGLCQGWVPPGTNYAVPTINYMSGTYSPAGATTLIAIFGSNFKLYSTIKFGTFTPTMIFISSQQIDFYVPSTASPGTYTVQVFNDTYGSNVITYELDDTPGYWLLSNIYPEAITNSNNGGLAVNGQLRINNSTLNTGDIVFGSSTSTSSSTSNQSIKWSNITSSITAANNSATFADTVYIIGDLNVSGEGFAIAFNNVSDYRIKDIIEPLNSDLYSVDNLKPIKYFNKKSKKEEIGFLAHEVQESFPCLVTGKKDGEGLQTLNYIGLIGILTKEIQCLKADVAELKRNQK